MFDCQLCQQESRVDSTINNNTSCSNSEDAIPQKLNQFASLSELEAHLASEHFNCLPYECEQCHFAKFPTEFAVIKHNEEDHGNKCYSFRCRITPALKQKRAQIKSYLIKIKRQQTLSPVSVENGRLEKEINLESCNNKQANNQTDEKLKQLQQQSEYTEEVNERNKLKPLSKDALKKKSIVNYNNGLSSKDGLNEDMEGIEDDLALNKASSSLTEQLQAACAQNIRHRRAVNEKESCKNSQNFGGTVSIREGEELASNIILGKSRISTEEGGNTTEEENDELEEMEDFDDNEMLLGGRDEYNEELDNNHQNENGKEEDNEQFKKQEADVQEILKAARAATSQVSQNDVVPRNNSSPYSLRPNRFTPYAALHGGKNGGKQKSQQQQSSSTQPKQQRQNWQLKLGNNTRFGSNGSNNTKLPLLMNNRRERNVERIRCRKCGELVNSTGGCLMHHLNTRHLHLPLFQCLQCNKDFYEVSNTRIHKHMRLYHNGDTSNLISNYAKYSHALHSGRDNCFGTREERMREIQRERGLTSNPLSLDGNIDLSSLISTVTSGKALNNNQNNRFPPLPTSSSSQQQIGGGINNKSIILSNQFQKEFLRPTISFKQYGNKQHNSLLKQDKTQVDESPNLSGPFQQQNNTTLDDLFNNKKIKSEFSTSDNDEMDIDLNIKNKFDKNFNNEENNQEEEQEDDEYNEEEEDQLINDDEINNELRQQQQNNKNNNNIKNNKLSIESITKKLNEKYNNNIEGTSNLNNSGNNKISTSSTSTCKQEQQQQSFSSLQLSQPQYQMMQMQLGIEEKIPCKVCGEMVLNKMLNRLNHVNARHLHLPLHQCRLCQKSFSSYSRSACYSHVQFAHRADLDSGLYSQNIEEHIIYMKEQYNNQLMEEANDYFD